MTPAERKAHFARVAALPCICCDKPCEQLHHPIGRSLTSRGFDAGRGKKRPDALVLPMCAYDHAALHADVELWESRFGTQAENVDWLGEQLGIDLWALARADVPAPKPRKAKKRAPLRDPSVKHLWPRGRKIQSRKLRP